MLVLGATAAVLMLRGSAGKQQGSPITMAAFVTSREPGLRFSFKLEGAVGGHSFALTAFGGEQEPSQRGWLDMTVAGHRLRELIAAPDVYLQSSGLPGGTASGTTPWVKVNATEMMQAMGAGGPISNGDPSQQLAFLRATGVSSKVGSETIGGVLTTHYRGLADLNRYASSVAPSLRAAAQQNAAFIRQLTGRSSLPVDVWVDAQQRVRQIQFEMSMCTVAGPLNEQLRMDFFDYGPQPGVTIPPPSKVTDLTSRVASTMSRVMQQLRGSC